jgi:hypothetical protein
MFEKLQGNKRQFEELQVRTAVQSPAGAMAVSTCAAFGSQFSWARWWHVAGSYVPVVFLYI